MGLGWHPVTERPGFVLGLGSTLSLREKGRLTDPRGSAGGPSPGRRGRGALLQRRRLGLAGGTLSLPRTWPASPSEAAVLSHGSETGGSAQAPCPPESGPGLTGRLVPSEVQGLRGWEPASLGAIIIALRQTCIVFNAVFRSTITWNSCHTGVNKYLLIKCDVPDTFSMTCYSTALSLMLTL